MLFMFLLTSKLHSKKPSFNIQMFTVVILILLDINVKHLFLCIIYWLCLLYLLKAGRQDWAHFLCLY